MSANDVDMAAMIQDKWSMASVPMRDLLDREYGERIGKTMPPLATAVDAETEELSLHTTISDSLLPAMQEDSERSGANENSAAAAAKKKIETAEMLPLASAMAEPKEPSLLTSNSKIRPTAGELIAGASRGPASDRGAEDGKCALVHMEPMSPHTPTAAGRDTALGLCHFLVDAHSALSAERFATLTSWLREHQTANPAVWGLPVFSTANAPLSAEPIMKYGTPQQADLVTKLHSKAKEGLDLVTSRVSTHQGVDYEDDEEDDFEDDDEEDTDIEDTDGEEADDEAPHGERLPLDDKSQRHLQDRHRPRILHAFASRQQRPPSYKIREEYIHGAWCTVIEQPTRTGADGFFAIKVHKPPGATRATRARIVAAFENIIDDAAAPKSFGRGRKHGAPFISVDSDSSNRAELTRAVVGPKLAALGLYLTRALGFKGFSNMSTHYDSGKEGGAAAPARMFIKYCGFYWRGSDAVLEEVAEEHDYFWVYTSPAAAFVSKHFGGWGAKHAAGALDEEPAFSAKINMGGGAPATYEQMCMAVEQVLSMHLDTIAVARPARTEEEILALRLCHAHRCSAWSLSHSFAQIDARDDLTPEQKTAKKDDISRSHGSFAQIDASDLTAEQKTAKKDDISRKNGSFAQIDASDLTTEQKTAKKDDISRSHARGFAQIDARDDLTAEQKTAKKADLSRSRGDSREHYQSGTDNGRAVFTEEAHAAFVAVVTQLGGPGASSLDVRSHMQKQMAGEVPTCKQIEVRMEFFGTQLRERALQARDNGEIDAVNFKPVTKPSVPPQAHAHVTKADGTPRFVWKEQVLAHYHAAVHKLGLSNVTPTIVEREMLTVVPPQDMPSKATIKSKLQKTKLVVVPLDDAAKPMKAKKALDDGAKPNKKKARTVPKAPAP